MARPTFSKHPKTSRAIHLLKIPPAHFRGLMEQLWDVANDSGEEVIGDSVDVELAAGWTGKTGAFTKAILECGGKDRSGLIEEVDWSRGIFAIHDFYDHCPDYVRSAYIAQILGNIPSAWRMVRQDPGDSVERNRCTGELAGEVGASTSQRASSGRFLPVAMGHRRTF